MVIAERYTGASVRRKEDPRILTGRGNYIADVTMPGMAHAAFLRSPFPHARIRSRAQPSYAHACTPAPLLPACTMHPCYLHAPCPPATCMHHAPVPPAHARRPSCPPSWP